MPDNRSYHEQLAADLTQRVMEIKNARGIISAVRQRLMVMGADVDTLPWLAELVNANSSLSFVARSIDNVLNLGPYDRRPWR